MDISISRRSFMGLAAAGTAGVMLGLSGCSGSSDDDGSAESSSSGSSDVTLIVKADGDPSSFNPDSTADDNYLPVADNIFNRLVKLDNDSNVLPDAAESWEVSDDSLTITFHLRDDLVWTDGEKLTAEDARYTFETIRTTSAYFFCSYLASVESIEATDDTTLVFHMSSPDVALITNLGWYANFIMPQHIYDVDGLDWDDNEAASLDSPESVVSSGPYRITGYKQGQTITLEANEQSPVQPNISNVVFSIVTDETTAVQALLNDEIDVYSGLPSANLDEVEADSTITVTSLPKAVPLRIIFNMEDERLSDLAVRKAIAMCVDRETISAKVSDGTMPADYCMYPPVIPWCCNTEDIAPEYDLEAAEECLIEAGYEKDSDGYYITGLEIDTFEFAGLPDMAKLIVAEMESIGIECSVNTLESNAWSDKCMTQHDFSLCMMGGTMGPDPSSLALRYGTDGSSNVGLWSNEEFDELCALGNAESDEDTRADLYKQAQAIMAEELPMVPILDWVQFFGYANTFKNMPDQTETDDGTSIGCYEFFYVDLA